MPKRLHPDPEIESLIQQLNQSARQTDDSAEAAADTELTTPAAPAAAAARWPVPDATEEGEQWLTALLGEARQLHASDLLLVAGAFPVARVNGKLKPLAGQKLHASGVAALCGALTPASHREMLAAEGAVDFALTRSGLGRFRCNVHRERGRWAAAVRLLPEGIPDLEGLHLPATLDRFTTMNHGLVLVTGPTGSGKSTTLAALMRQILARRQVHAITIEDPVEYTHPHVGSLVEHIEIDRDAGSFAGALRAALRQDPDVLLIGEMRDPESISIAITAAETGHLVLSTLHTGDAPQTIHRILDSYPARQMETVRVQLSISLAGVISQQLLPRGDGQGRVPAVEVLIVTPAVRNLIRQGKIAHIRSQITLERAAGMLSLDSSLVELVRNGLVEVDEARPRARVPEEFDGLLRRMSGPSAGNPR